MDPAASVADVLPSRARVLLVDDHRLFADAIRHFLEAGGMDVLMAATSPEEAIEAVRDTRPDVVLLDLGLPGRSGISVGKEIKEISPETIVVVVTALNDSRVVQEVMAAGLNGYLTKDTPLDRFLPSIRAALEGHMVLPHRVTRTPREADPESEQAALLAAQLTRREREILALLVEGVSSGEIARRLSVSRNTVRTHVHNVLSKLQVNSRLGAVAFAVKHRLVLDDALPPDLRT